jgi:hypothetical protein
MRPSDRKPDQLRWPNWGATTTRRSSPGPSVGSRLPSASDACISPDGGKGVPYGDHFVRREVSVVAVSTLSASVKRRGMRARIVLGLCAALLLLLVVPAASSAHISRYCGHGFVSGPHWFVQYSSYVNENVVTSSDPERFHVHFTDHSYRSSPSYLYSPHDSQSLVCGHVIGSAATVDMGTYEDLLGSFLGSFSWVLDPADVAPNSADCNDAGLNPNQTQECNCMVGGEIDGTCQCNEPIPCAAIPPPPAAPTASVDSKQASALPDPPRVVAAVRSMGFGVRVVQLQQGVSPRGGTALMDRPVAVAQRDGCVIAIGDEHLDSYDPNNLPRLFTVEVATHGIAARVGHTC